MDIALIEQFLKFSKVKRIKREGQIAAYYPTGVRALQPHQLPKEFINWFERTWEVRNTMQELKPNFLRIEELWNDFGDLFTQVLRLLGINNIRGLERNRKALDRIAEVMRGEIKNEIARRIKKDRDYFGKGDFEGKAFTKGQIISILDMWTRLNIVGNFASEVYNGGKTVRDFVKALDMDGFEDGHKINKSFTNFLIKYLVWNTEKLGFIRLDSERDTCLKFLIRYIQLTNKRDSHEIRNAFISFTRIKKGKVRNGAQAGEYREGRPGLWINKQRDMVDKEPFVTFSNRTKKASAAKKRKKVSKRIKATRLSQSKQTKKVSTTRIEDHKEEELRDLA